MKKRILSLFLCGLLGLSISIHGQWEDHYVVAPYCDGYVMFSAKPLLEDLTDTKIENILLKFKVWEWKIYTGFAVVVAGVYLLAYVLETYKNEKKRKNKSSTISNKVDPVS